MKMMYASRHLIHNFLIEFVRTTKCIVDAGAYMHFELSLMCQRVMYISNDWDS